MNPKTATTVLLTAALTAAGLFAAKAMAKGGVPSTGGKVVCVTHALSKDVPDYIEEQLAAGRTNIQMTGDDGILVCAW